MQYLDIVNIIRTQITDGQLVTGQKLPSERQLAESFSTTRVTLREALSALESDGLIYREDRRGWFISGERIGYNPNELKDICERPNEDIGLENPIVSNTVSVKKQIAKAQTAVLLHLPPFGETVELQRIHQYKGRRVVWSTHCINSKWTKNDLSEIGNQSLLNVLNRDQSLSLKKFVSKPSSLTGDIAKYLNATPGSPCLIIETIWANSAGEPVVVNTEYWRQDVVSIEVNF